MLRPALCRFQLQWYSVTLGQLRDARRARRIPAHALADFIRTRLDQFALPNWRPSRRGEWGGQASGATNGSQPESHTPLPWVPQPYEWLGTTRDLKGRAA